MRTRGDIFIIALALFGSLYFMADAKAAETRELSNKAKACVKQKYKIPVNSGGSMIGQFNDDMGTCFIRCLNINHRSGSKKCKTVTYCPGDYTGKCKIYDNIVPCSNGGMFEPKVDKRKKCRTWTNLF